MAGLHRKKSLQRKKPLRDHQPNLPGTPLTRTMQLRSSGPLSPMSAKRRSAQLDRRNFVAQFLGKNPRCMVRWNGGCTGWAVHVHEPLTRARGGSITDPANAVATCWWCHAMIHDHPEEATARGWLRSAS